MPPENIQQYLSRVAARGDLTAEEAGDVFDAVMSGVVPASHIAALLMGLRVKGETASEVAGAARALRKAMVSLPHGGGDGVVDTCGTGGGTVKTFNISTAAALLAAGAGVRIAKHGNRSFTTRSGSADVFEALGIALNAEPAVLARALSDAGMVFMFAPAMHPAMKHVGPVRRELGIPTIMNLVGPLANPAGARRQVLGVSTPDHLGLMAGALAELGVDHALVIHGDVGMDEVSPVGPTRGYEVRGGELRPVVIHPSEFGVRDMNIDELAGGSPEENAAMIVDVLSGRGRPAAVAAVLLNAAAAIYVSGSVPSLGDAFAEAVQALRGGKGMEALERLRSVQTGP